MSTVERLETCTGIRPAVRMVTPPAGTNICPSPKGIAQDPFVGTGVVPHKLAASDTSGRRMCSSFSSPGLLLRVNGCAPGTAVLLVHPLVFTCIRVMRPVRVVLTMGCGERNSFRDSDCPDALVRGCTISLRLFPRLFVGLSSYIGATSTVRFITPAIWCPTEFAASFSSSDLPCSWKLPSHMPREEQPGAWWLCKAIRAA